LLSLQVLLLHVLHLPTLLLLHLVSLPDLFSLQGLHLLLKHGALEVGVDVVAALQLILLLSHVVTTQILHLHQVLLLQLLHLPDVLALQLFLLDPGEFALDLLLLGHLLLLDFHELAPQLFFL
jgi:hypothetical protein